MADLEAYTSFLLSDFINDYDSMICLT